MKERAYAKINLSLDVFAIREDGYHDLHSIMLPIDFYDELEILKAKRDSFSCNRHFIRWNENNSIYKMIDIIRKKYDIKDHFRVTLKKYVPIQAGLGGGTADAAVTLKILQKMYGLSMSREEIIDVCLQVGADVPFNYFNVPAVVGGIGDVIEPLDMKKDYYILLVKSKSGVSTREVYEELDMEKCDHPDIERLKEALEKGEAIYGLLGNSLEEAALRINEDIYEVKELLMSYGIGDVLMSGSGSTVFCISEKKEDIDVLYGTLKDSGFYVRFTKTMRSK